MIAPRKWCPPAWVSLFAVCGSALLPAPARGQEPVPVPEIKVVVRVSRQLIDDVVARKEVVAAIPYQAKIIKFATHGVIDGSGKLAVDMTDVADDGIFVVTGRGAGSTYTRGVRG